VLVEVLLAFALQEDLVRLTVFFVEVEGRGDVEVVLKTGNVDKNGMASL
jgi:hypothetical protein